MLGRMVTLKPESLTASQSTDGSESTIRVCGAVRLDPGVNYERVDVRTVVWGSDGEVLALDTCGLDDPNAEDRSAPVPFAVFLYVGDLLAIQAHHLGVQILARAIDRPITTAIPMPVAPAGRRQSSRSVSEDGRYSLVRHAADADGETQLELLGVIEFGDGATAANAELPTTLRDEKGRVLLHEDTWVDSPGTSGLHPFSAPIFVKSDVAEMAKTLEIRVKSQRILVTPSIAIPAAAIVKLRTEDFFDDDDDDDDDDDSEGGGGGGDDDDSSWLQ